MLLQVLLKKAHGIAVVDAFYLVLGKALFAQGIRQQRQEGSIFQLVGADEEFETASNIKAFILAALYLQAQRGKADLAEEITYEQSQFVDGSGMLRALGVGAKLKVKDTATMLIICAATK